MNRNLPDWFENNAVNEVKFCEDFLKEKSLKCVNNVFYSVDGTLSDDVVSGEIYGKLSGFITSNIARKTDNLLKALKLHCHCENFRVSENEIHLQNGFLCTDGTFSDTRACSHKADVRIFEHKFVVFKAKIRRNTPVFQGFLAQNTAKFVKKTCVTVYVNTL